MVKISYVRIQADGCHSMIFFLLSLPGNDNSSAKFWIYLLQRRDRKEDADLSSLTGKTILHDYYQMDFVRIMFVIMFKLPLHLYLYYLAHKYTDTYPYLQQLNFNIQQKNESRLTNYDKKSSIQDQAKLSSSIRFEMRAF